MGAMNSIPALLDDKFALLQAFIEAANCLSFVDAAVVLSLTPSTLSRRIKRLEETLGVQLFVRTTRRVALTEAGEIYLEYSERVLAELREGDKVVSSLGAAPSGVLRVSAPSSFGRLRIASALPGFMHRYPNIQVNITYTDAYVDLIEQRIDVAVRIGTPVDSTLKKRFFAINHRHFVASPEYLEQHPEPLIPADLARHKCLHFSHFIGGNRWQMSKEGKTEIVPIRPVLMANDAQTLFQAACAGAGIAILADFILGSAVEDNRLKYLLPDWKIPETEIYAVYPATEFIAPKTRAFIDYFVELFPPIVQIANE
jgi:LysR family transcriptional regulator, transcriptional activator for dmlA